MQLAAKFLFFGVVVIVVVLVPVHIEVLSDHVGHLALA